MRINSAELQLSGICISGPTVVRIGLALRLNLSRILQNQLALKLPVIESSTGQCYDF